MIEDVIKDYLKSKKDNPEAKSIYRLALGEFQRIDDGKSITDDQAIKVLKRMIKSNEETISYSSGDKAFLLHYEIMLMKGLIPTENLATKMDMLKAIANSVPPGAKNRMGCMKPCIQYLEDKGFTIDKKQLSQLLREGE